ncbi:hypothetical protein [Pectinatus haikarae]|uniref:Uncharacterized protein n=1 Tax=Pectinatus haikarae TaxID=349096 RepID=A0ABT9Y6R5_9FIRM|nr:hypothetical protein [Pectinatus haikarae]MDQ0203338.1 hypothetical protein [Pectinatus haikarae]
MNRLKGGFPILKLFSDVEKNKNELEEILLRVRTDEIIYRQKNEIEIANRLKLLENQLNIAVKNLNDAMTLK